MAEDPAVRRNRATLDSLLMKTGSVPDLIIENNPWPKIAGGLKDVFLKYANTLSPSDKAEYAAHLCTVYCTAQKGITCTWDEGKKVDDQVPAIVDFMYKFMTAVGQWGYLREQDWFTSGEFIIAVDLNYYPDRSGFQEAPLFHKDTSGNNIFVNLIFDNVNDIEATEWFTDVAEPSKARTAWQAGLLPKGHLTNLDSARKTLRTTVDGTTEVSGGVSRGTYTYLSWVDDLVWHATPARKKRAKLTEGDLARVYDELNAKTNVNFEYFDEILNVDVTGAEILGTMADGSTTHLRDHLTHHELIAQDINVQVGKQVWDSLYRDNKASFIADAKQRVATDWRITGEYSVAISKDAYLTPSIIVNETPIGLSTRRRAHSLEKNEAELARVRLANQDLPRSFLRTWVRILPKGSAELTEAQVDLS